MNLKTIAVIACLSAAPAGAFAQGSFTEVMEVRVTNVDVVVTGKDGKPVPGLKLEDFELYEDGVKKEITNFAEVRESAPSATLTPSATAETPAAPSEPQDIRRRNVVVFIDNAALHPFRRKVILEHLQTFLKNNMRTGDEIAIITWANSLKAELEPTSDLSVLDSVMKKLQSQGSFTNEKASDLRSFQEQIRALQLLWANRGGKAPFTEAIGVARMYGVKVNHRARGRVEALKAVAASMRGAPGRKVLVFLTQDFSSNPADDAFAWLDSIRDEFDGVGVAMNDARDLELRDMVKEIAEAANSAGVTLYPIDGAGKDGGMKMTDASDNTRLGTSAIVVSQTAQLTMNSIAAETGGMALTGSTNWQLAFDTIANDLNTYYSLGYSSSGDKKDRLKKIEVRLKGKQKYAVRARHGVIEPSASSEMNDAVAAYLFREIGGNDLAIRASAGASTPGEGESTMVPLTITIPMEKLTLLPDGADLTGSFSVFAAFLRKDGAVSKVARQLQNFRIPAESLKRRKEITVKIDVKTDGRTDGISVGVMDDASRATGFAAVKLGE